MIKLSVFTATAVIAYFFGMIDSAGVAASQFSVGFAVFDSSGSQSTLPIAGFDKIVWVVLTAFAMRLYLHAWIVDESRRFQSALRGKGPTTRALEWSIRALWVTGMAGFPLIVTGSSVILNRLLPVPAFTWMGIMGASSLVWGLLMRTLVLSYSNEAKEDLMAFWIWPDIVNVIALFFVSLFLEWGWRELDPRWANWGVATAMVSFTVLLVMSVIQIVVWFPGIWREAQTSRMSHP